MAKGSANFDSTLVTGNVVPPDMANDIQAMLSRADDETLYDLIDIEPPTGASATKVNVGYIPLRAGPLVTGDASARVVHVAPVRIVRSSQSASTPRAILSATLDTLGAMALPSAPPAGKWGIELLYAQLSHVDASDPAKGAQVQFLWAPAPTYVNTGTAATPASLPANSSTYWNVPIRYVKNINGATSVAEHDILSPTPSTTGGYDGRLRRRIGGSGMGAIDARRGYASTPQDIAALAAASAITHLLTPAKAHKEDAEFVVRHFNLPASMTGDTAGVATYTDLDDTRDWRNGTFISFWSVATLDGTPAVYPLYLGEEDAATGASATRQAPTTKASGTAFPAQYTQWGQSFEPDAAWTPVYRIAHVADTGTYGSSPTAGTPFFTTHAADYLALAVSSAGVLQLRRAITAAVAGGPVSILLIGIFPNSR